MRNLLTLSLSIVTMTSASVAGATGAPKPMSASVQMVMGKSMIKLPPGKLLAPLRI